MRHSPGKLDQLVKIMRATITPDALGGNDHLPLVEVSEEWCEVLPLSGGEVGNFQQLNAEAKYLFSFRNGLDVLDSDSLKWDGILYNIRFRRQPKTRALYVELEAERGVAQ